MLKICVCSDCKKIKNDEIKAFADVMKDAKKSHEFELVFLGCTTEMGNMYRSADSIETAMKNSIIQETDFVMPIANDDLGNVSFFEEVLSCTDMFHPELTFVVTSEKEKYLADSKMNELMKRRSGRLIVQAKLLRRCWKQEALLMNFDELQRLIFLRAAVNTAHFLVLPCKAKLASCEGDRRTKAWYSTAFFGPWHAVCKEYDAKGNAVPRSLQYEMLIQLLKRIDCGMSEDVPCNEMNREEARTQFLVNANRLLDHIDNTAIGNYDSVSELKLNKTKQFVCAGLKKHSAIWVMLSKNNLDLCFEDCSFGVNQIKIEHLEKTDKMLKITASTDGLFEAFGVKVSARVGRTELPLQNEVGNEVKLFNLPVYATNIYKLSVPLKKLSGNMPITWWQNYDSSRKQLKIAKLGKLPVKVHAQDNYLFFDEGDFPVPPKKTLQGKKNMAFSALCIICTDGKEAPLHLSLEKLQQESAWKSGKLRALICYQSTERSSQDTETLKTLKAVCSGQEQVELCNSKNIKKYLRKYNRANSYFSVIQAGEYYHGNFFSEACNLMEQSGVRVALPRCENNSPGNSTDNRIISLRDNPEMTPTCAFGAMFRVKQALNGDFTLLDSDLNSLPFRDERELLSFWEQIDSEELSYGRVGMCTFATDEPQAEAIKTYPYKGKSEWYFCALWSFYEKLTQIFKGEMPDCAQLLLLYRLMFRLKANENNSNTQAFSSAKLPIWEKNLHTILQSISDEVIFGNVVGGGCYAVKPHVRLYLLHAKNPDAYQLKLCCTKNNLFLLEKSRAMLNVKSEKAQIELMDYDKTTLLLECTTRGFFEQANLYPQASYNGEPILVEPVYYYTHRKFFGQAFWRRYSFRIRVPLEKNKGGKLEVYYIFHKKKYPIAFFSTRYTAKLCSTIPGAYWSFGNHIASFAPNNSALEIEPYSRQLREKKELALFYKSLTQPQPSGRRIALVGMGLRTLYWLSRGFLKKKRIWITHDKLYKGGDCGEYFFRHAAGRNEPVQTYYVANRDTETYRTMKREGLNVLAYGTLKQRLYYMYAEAFFNTHGGVHKFQAFSDNLVRYVADLLRADVFTIQHGLTIQDLAFNANICFNNVRRYYCASKYEVMNLERPIYGYNPQKQLALMGIPRYDGLKNNEKRLILITPTWRNYLTIPGTQPNGARPYFAGFRDTEYFKLYNALLCDKRLIETAQKTGYKLVYLLHPVTSSQISDYPQNAAVELVQGSTVNYEEILCQSSLMVTDYSGVQFDFAYMRKPIVYYHPPKLPPHYETSDFDYETVGFGKICREHNDLVDTLCWYMENECQLTPEYRQRQDQFFAYDDHESSRRIFDDAYAFEHKRRKNQFKLVLPDARVAPNLSLWKDRNEKSAVLSWTACADAVSYEVQFGNYPDGTYTTLAILDADKCAYPVHALGWYRVRAVYGSRENCGPFSQPLNVRKRSVSLCKTMKAPIILSARQTPQGLRLVWSGNAKACAWRIYRKTDELAQPELLKELDNLNTWETIVEGTAENAVYYMTALYWAKKKLLEETEKSEDFFPCNIDGALLPKVVFHPDSIKLHFDTQKAFKTLEIWCSNGFGAPFKKLSVVKANAKAYTDDVHRGSVSYCLRCKRNGQWWTSPILQLEVPKVLEKPKGLLVRREGTITKLFWNAEMNISGYNIRRYTENGEKAELVAQLPAIATNWVDSFAPEDTFGYAIETFCESEAGIAYSGYSKRVLVK